jgi:hypothetical protein
VLKTRDGSDVAGSERPELTPSGDAVVARSGDRPAGPADSVFRGVDAVEVVPGTQSPEPQAASSTLAGPRLHRSDLLSFAELRIAAPFLYDQWQARTEIVTKVYGQEQTDAEEDLCQFSLLIPRSGLLSFMTISLGLNLEDEAGKRFLVSPPVIMPSQLMRADGEALHLDVRSTTASGGATAAWRVSEVPGGSHRPYEHTPRQPDVARPLAARSLFARQRPARPHRSRKRRCVARRCRFAEPDLQFPYRLSRTTSVDAVSSAAGAKAKPLAPISP